jgi:cholesterol transport system auxiliary component
VIRTFGALLLMVSLVAACAQPEVPEDRFYRLSLPAPEKTLAKPPLDGTLEIERFVADGLTAGRPIVYSKAETPNQVHEYHYDFWTEPPTIMLRDQLVAYLRVAGVATKIVTPDLRADPEFVLTGRIKRMEQVLGSPTGAVVELELALRRTSDATVMFVETYRIEAKAKSDKVAAAVTAINGAVAEIYAKCAKDLAGI